MSQINGDGLVELKVSSPGKVILFGEHAVVYGKTALAASLGLRSVFSLEERADMKFCEIEMPGVGLSNFRLSVEQLQSSLLIDDGEDNVDENTLHSRLLERARDYVRQHVDTSNKLDQRQKCSIECLLYALARVTRAEGLRRLSTGFLLKMTSDLPLGAGLGSSASYSVCLVAGLLIWARLRCNTAATDPLQLDRESLCEISRHAFGCEKIMHGAPSGVDNEVCTYGSVIEFRRGEEPIKLSLVGGLRVLLVDTKVQRSTKLLVDKLARLRAQYPEVFDLVFQSIDLTCRRAVEVLANLDQEGSNEHLSTLIDINQGLLSTCQVSHPTIDSICATAKKHGLSAKLTGAGGGGFVYVLIPPDVPATKLQSVTSELCADGFAVIETSLGGSGLMVHNASIRK